MIFRNTYYGMRHGESEANAQNIAITDPEVGIRQYGLTQIGRQQAHDAIVAHPTLDASTLIIASPFLRTRQTAEIVRTELGTEDVVIWEGLRERGCGTLHGTVASSAHQQMKSMDASQNYVDALRVETSTALGVRMLEVLLDLEQRFDGRCLLLVSHGDPLQMLEAVVGGVAPRYFRQISMPDKAEVRLLAKVDDVLEISTGV
jgi:broad specificity phosphatase PhoE